MNPNLTKDQEKELCSQLGNVSLQLLYKASVHGFTGAAFHQRCDHQSPTLTVGYNSSGFVFGGYTSKAFGQADTNTDTNTDPEYDFKYGYQTKTYIQDDKAFLFSFSGKKLVRYHVKDARYACFNDSNCGPSFGADLIFFPSGQATIQTTPGNFYNHINARQMHGNNLRLAECEVYGVEEDGSNPTKPFGAKTIEKPWRNILWKAERRKELMDSIKFYKPIITSVSQVRVLLMGPIGAGKSSFFNSINSIFRGHVTGQAIAGSSSTSLTTRFRTYSVKAGRDGKPLPIVLCDTMGLEEATGAGLDVEDISSILKGHTPDRYQFNPSAPLQAEAQGYLKSVELKDRIHCVAYVIDTNKVSIMPTKLEEKLAAIRRKANLLGIPQLVLMTKVDEACPSVAKDLKDIYKSQYIKDKAQEVSCRLGVPLSCVVPVKNYSEELELELSCDILLLSAVLQMLRFADNYFDEVSDQCSHLETHD